MVARKLCLQVRRHLRQRGLYVIRLRSLRKNAHSCLRFLLILGIAAPFCRSYRGNGIGGVLCIVSVSFSRFFCPVRPLKKPGGIADRGSTGSLFCRFSVSVRGGFYRSKSCRLPRCGSFRRNIWSILPLTV